MTIQAFIELGERLGATREMIEHLQWVLEDCASGYLRMGPLDGADLLAASCEVRRELQVLMGLHDSSGVVVEISVMMIPFDGHPFLEDKDRGLLEEVYDCSHASRSGPLLKAEWLEFAGAWIAALSARSDIALHRCGPLTLNVSSSERFLDQITSRAARAHPSDGTCAHPFLLEAIVRLAKQ